jgi:transcriptional regulator with PAS, ATPase and Fis domain
MSEHSTLIGSSASIRTLDGDITAASQSDAKVLITGESGVGKEVAARLIHARSQRGHQTLVTVNCAGLPDSLLETELFGHVKGSFTGAYRDKQGLLKLAHNGTIFLDEVGEMSLRMQAMLLRFLETGEIQQVGATRLSTRLNVRVICATHRDLRTRVREGAFREDLFYRLNVVHVHIPPVRERPEDLVDLLRYFFTCAERDRMPPTITPEALDLLKRHDWPGNVREIKNVVERMVVGGKSVIDVADLPLEVRLARFAGARARQDDLEYETPSFVARRLLDRMLRDGGSFWDVVYEPFAAHDLTRQHLRLVVSFGLEQCQGRYTTLTELFNMKKGDYKRFLAVLRKHDCMVSSHAFRNARPGTAANEPEDDDATWAQT